jgi:predicted amidohydrolase YtcJ
MKSKFLVYLFLFQSFGCKKEPSQLIDLIIHNAYVYTVDAKKSTFEAVGISKGKIVFLGNSKDALALKNPDTKVIDAKGNFLMPGFIEGHGHFSGLGFSLLNLNLLKSTSWESIIDSVKNRTLTTQKNAWIEGRGWHQEKWNTKPKNTVDGYPQHADLSAISPDHPIILYHASGHSLYANQKAMDLAGVNNDTPDPIGGRIVRNQDKIAIGVFEERAMSIIKNAYEDYKKSLPKSQQDQRWLDAITLAQIECINKGVTSFQDAGSKFFELDNYEKLAKENKLSVRLWVMARHSFEEMKDKLSAYKKIGIGQDFYTCNAIKSEVDGALGAFGAWLLKPYSDKPDFHGQNTTDIVEVKKIGELAMSLGMQFCVHSIGDRANRVVLDIFDGLASKNTDKKDLRWRVEHAQHLDPIDFKRFVQGGYIASMQAVHCTSDAPFVAKRLGVQRAKYGSYAWRSLLDIGVKIANGTDTPVEDIDPIKNFYASVTRKREIDGLVFYPEQRMTRAEAIKSYTIDNAFAAKEDLIKGSIEIGKYADLVILSKNLLTTPDQSILDTKVLFTIVNGKILKK